MIKHYLVAAAVATLFLGGCAAEKTEPAPVEHKTEVNIINPSAAPMQKTTETNQTTTDPMSGTSTTTTTTTTEEKR